MEDIELKRILYFILFSSILIVPVTATAAKQYLLPKIGVMSIDVNQAASVTSVGLLYGYKITQKFTIESELNYGISGGHYDKTLVSGTRLQGGYDLSTIATYGVYRHSLSNKIFTKAKLGLIYEDIQREGTLTTGTGVTQSDSDHSQGFGLAGGYGIGIVLDTRYMKNSIVELEVTAVDEDIVFYSLGFNYAF